MFHLQNNMTQHQISVILAWCSFKVEWFTFKVTWFTLKIICLTLKVAHWHWFWCLSGLSEVPRGVYGRSTGALRCHLTIFHKYVENLNIWIRTFWSLLEPMSNFALVKNVFKSNNEAQFEPCCKSALFIIYLRQELLCIFIDFDVFGHQKKVLMFALNRCV